MVTGEIVQEGNKQTADLMVELRDSLRHTTIDKQPVSPSGAFEFRRVPAGQYELWITNFRGDLIRQEFVSIRGHNGPLSLRLPKPASPNKPIGGIVSAARLRHRVVPKARKEFEKSVKAMQKGDLQVSIGHLTKAVEIDTAYMEAHNDLGARYMMLGDYVRASVEFQTAIALDPSSVMAHSNLSISAYSLKRYDEAEAAARAAVRLDPASVKARYMLCLILEAEDKNRLEALQNLKTVSGEFPKARLVAARILIRQGKPAEAADELRGYLATSDAEYREAVEAWLARLPQ